MQPKRSMASNPFAQVFLNMLNLWDREEIALPDLSIRYLGGLDLHMPVDVLDSFRGSQRREFGVDVCLQYGAVQADHD